MHVGGSGGQWWQNNGYPWVVVGGGDKIITGRAL